MFKKKSVRNIKQFMSTMLFILFGVGVLAGMLNSYAILSAKGDDMLLILFTLPAIIGGLLVGSDKYKHQANFFLISTGLFYFGFFWKFSEVLQFVAGVALLGAMISFAYAVLSIIYFAIKSELESD